jgi:hypothetical protein
MARIRKPLPGRKRAPHIMGYEVNRATMEAELARAHRALVHAKRAADLMDDNGAYLDITQIEVEVVRVAEASLKSRKHPRGVLETRLDLLKRA